MFQVLLESRSVRARRAGSTVASALTHGVVLAAVIWLARPGAGRAITTHAPTQPPVYLIPAQPTPQIERRPEGRSGVTGTRIVANPTFNMTTLPPIDIALTPPVANDPIAPPGDGFNAIALSLGGGPVYTGEVIEERLVDRAPRVIGRAPEPRYPAPLRDAGIEGRVVAEFVVDTLGRAELDGLKLDAPQALFADAVRAVLPRYRFTPGEAAGHKVRTRVQLPFDFALTR
ncbi:MAG: energy transducer TonB [Gemmatimonadota bacterium]|nr:energy transducer TonB [Gemmatimonadota bacterium]